MPNISSLSAADQKVIVAHHNIYTSIHFTAFLFGYIFLFVLFRIAYILSLNYGNQYRVVFNFFALPTRLARRVLIRSIPVLPSAGHALAIIIYILANVILGVTFSPGLPYYNQRNWFPKRLGWYAPHNLTPRRRLTKLEYRMTLMNLSVCFIFSFKNTPLGFLTGYSYERIMVLHSMAGWCTLVAWMLHWTWVER
jgi:hypothetical protein